MNQQPTPEQIEAVLAKPAQQAQQMNERLDEMLAEMRSEKEERRAKEREMLRDHFAGLAMAPFIQVLYTKKDSVHLGELAKSAYAIADAMLRARGAA